MIKIGKYNFEGPFKDLNSVKDSAGIYVILCLIENQYTVIDVGESTELNTRLSNHDRKNCWNRNCNGTLHVAILYTEGLSEDQRRKIEAELRAQFNPPCGER